MTDINALRAAYQEARLRAPHWNSYRLATTLGVSEGELMAARLDDTDTLGEEVHGLALTPCDLALALPRLGELRIATRSRHGELTSLIQRMTVRGNDYSAALKAQNGLSMQWLLPHWHWACLRRSFSKSHTLGWTLQVFDRFGQALHTLEACEPRAGGWSWLLDKALDEVPRFTRRIATPTPAIDRQALLTTWQHLRHHDDYRRLLSDHGLSPLDLNRALEGRFSRQCAPARFSTALEEALESQASIVLSMPSRAGLHRHATTLQQIERHPSHLAIQGREVTLGLDTDALTSVWQVERCSESCLEHWLEAFDSDGELMASVRLAA
ncbi:ChuX/HutX family heme-like substrate-binding protein [Larsenimonas rhizosphaerae]|uniref:Haemin-degrading HemS/ChuX domain-containing protein n=1 Tax=Larsenimonas rhizosphaerae TaxID=2944682 RepID=A0AA41ZIV9_9GAMM|nr:hypothetical protein [Larsenimonas rhizosphaerae]MCX2524718.1 hypothetical protein [Larsenimonas rhizosphaerae]